uniref:Uncharacterized protein n=1 Tax=Setaria viridis TaxID=4556 RepID=A0A4U6UAN5_SETVI|nr:hypothetical protein SEVIR_7G299603v2 [Setaria viridis]
MPTAAATSCLLPCAVWRALQASNGDPGASGHVALLHIICHNT